MDWTRRVEFAYRAYVRQHMDVSLRFQEVGAALVKTTYVREGRIQFVELDDAYWPLRPEDEVRVDTKGYLITEFDGRRCLVIREMLMTVDIRSDWEAMDVVADFIDRFGEGTFASIRVIEELSSGVQAV